MEHKRVETGKSEEGRQKKRDRLWVHALILFNLAMWVCFGWIVLLVLRSL
jgi:hypothetical protein